MTGKWSLSTGVSKIAYLSVSGKKKPSRTRNKNPGPGREFRMYTLCDFGKFGIHNVIVRRFCPALAAGLTGADG